MLAILVALVVPTWLLGGFEQEPKKKLPLVNVGTTVEYGQLKVRPLGVTLLQEHPVYEFSTKKGKSYLTAQFWVENRTKEPVYGFGDLILLGSPVFPKGTEPAESFLVRDEPDVGSLLPHLPEKVMVIWEIPDAQANRIGTDLTLTLQRNTYWESFFQEEKQWSAPKPWLRLKAPVQRKNG